MLERVKCSIELALTDLSDFTLFMSFITRKVEQLIVIAVESGLYGVNKPLKSNILINLV